MTIQLKLESDLVNILVSAGLFILEPGTAILFELDIFDFPIDPGPNVGVGIVVFLDPLKVNLCRSRWSPFFFLLISHISHAFGKVFSLYF